MNKHRYRHKKAGGRHQGSKKGYHKGCFGRQEPLKNTEEPLKNTEEPLKNTEDTICTTKNSK